MALYPASTIGMTWALLKDGTYVFQAIADLTSYSSVSYQAVGAIPQSVIGGSGSVAARELGIDNSMNTAAVTVAVGKLYKQTVPPFTITTIELGDTSPMIVVTGGGACVLTFSTGLNPGTGVATNPYAATLQAIGVALPSGVMMMYAGPVGNVPPGWQLCDGSALSRANQQSLYQAIGTLYGVGDGSSTFNVPDLRGQFARGFDNGRGIDANRVLGSTQATATQTFALNIGVTNTGGNIYVFNQFGIDTYQGVTSNYTAFGNTSSNQPINFARTDSVQRNVQGESRPPNVAVNYIIKL